MNKKAWVEGKIGDVIMVVLVLLICLVVYWQLSGKTHEATGELQSCTVLGFGNGNCRDVEDTNCYKTGSCPEEQPYCCISLEAKEKSIMPEPYGGDSRYDFSVGYIGLATSLDTDKKHKPPGECTFDNEFRTSMECPENKELTIPVTVGVMNKGTGIARVKASPYYSINDDPEKVKQAPLGQETTLSQPAATPGTQPSKYIELKSTEIKIQGTDTASGNYVKIYPYALCDRNECRSADKRGTLKNNIDPNVYMTIKFVKK